MRFCIRGHQTIAMGQIQPTAYSCTAHKLRMDFKILNGFILNGYYIGTHIISLTLPLGPQSLNYFLAGSLQEKFVDSCSIPEKFDQVGMININQLKFTNVCEIKQLNIYFVSLIS